jgi:hypothetical protein
MDSANAEMKGPAMAENNLPREFLITPPTPETYRFVEFRVTRLDRFSTFGPIFLTLGNFGYFFRRYGHLKSLKKGCLDNILEAIWYFFKKIWSHWLLYQQMSYTFRMIAFEIVFRSRACTKLVNLKSTFSFSRFLGIKGISSR